MKKSILTLLLGAFSYGIVCAQTPADAIMMKQFEACFALTYDYGSWDHYWEGDYLRTNGNVGTFQRRIVTPMIAVGVHDKLNLLVSLPYVKTFSKEPNGGYLTGVDGFQDIGINLKAQVLKKELVAGTLEFLTNVGYSTPATNYLSDYMPYSLGFGAPELNLRGIGGFKLSNGLYGMVAIAHLWRGQTQIERDYYYNNGSYYTDLMDVPDAWNYHIAAGIRLLNNALKVEVNYMGLSCTSGDDIRAYNAPQPTNKVEIGQAGLMAQYYFNKVDGLGLLAYYAKVISGRNMGEFSTIGLGATYQFKFFNTGK